MLTMFLTVVAVPMGLVVVMNIFLYCLVLAALVRYDTQHPNEEKSVYSQQATIKDVAAVAGQMIIFIMALVFIVLPFIGLDTVFQVFFATTCIIYGVYCFTFFVLFSNDARVAWKEVFRIMKCKKKYGYDVNSVNTYEMSAARSREESNVTMLSSKDFSPGFHIDNPYAEEDLTFENPVHSQVLTNFSDRSTMENKSISIEVVGEIEDHFDLPNSNASAKIGKNSASSFGIHSSGVESLRTESPSKRSVMQDEVTYCEIEDRPDVQGGNEVLVNSKPGESGHTTKAVRTESDTVQSHKEISNTKNASKYSANINPRIENTLIFDKTARSRHTVHQVMKLRDGSAAPEKSATENEYCADVAGDIKNHPEARSTIESQDRQRRCHSAIIHVGTISFSDDEDSD